LAVAWGSSSCSRRRSGSESLAPHSAGVPITVCATCWQVRAQRCLAHHTHACCRRYQWRLTTAPAAIEQTA